jgi:Phage tail tube protein
VRVDAVNLKHVLCQIQPDHRNLHRGRLPNREWFRRLTLAHRCRSGGRPSHQGSIKRAGSPVGNLTGGSVTYSNNLEKIETIRDDGLIEGADPTIAALTGRIDVRFADTTLIDLAAVGSPVDLEFAYTLSAQMKLVLTAHEVYLPKPKLAVEGPGGVQASFDFRGAKNTVAGRMLTVTLTNDLDGLVYG